MFQGADSKGAPTADRGPRKVITTVLEGLGAIPIQRRDTGALQRIRSGTPSANNKNNEALHRPVSTSSPRCPMPARQRTRSRSTRKLLNHQFPGTLPMRPGYAEECCAPVLLLRPRLKERTIPTSIPRLRIYDGENLQRTPTQGQSPSREYRGTGARRREGMNGLSTHVRLKILSRSSTTKTSEVAATRMQPGSMCFVAADRAGAVATEVSETLSCVFIKGVSGTPLCRLYRARKVQDRVPESYSGIRQNIFDRYVDVRRLSGFRSELPRTGHRRDPQSRLASNEELEKIEKPAAFSNPRIP